MNHSPAPALKVSGLSYAYGERHALAGVSFDLAPGSCTILLGPNGAGKSTLFSLITRLYDSKDGYIEIAGFELKRHSREALERLGVVFQQPTLDMDLSVEQNLRYHAALHGLSRKEADTRIREELERQAMYERRGEKIRQLNGGHRRRVEIARALLHKPSLLLLDEPTVGLDVPSRKAIVDYVHRLCADGTLAVLWATHLIDEIHPQDRLIVLHKGTIRAEGSLSQVLDAGGSDSIDAAFHALTGGTA